MQAMTMSEIERLLSEALIGRLAMAGRDGRPYAIPLPFCWHENSLYLRLPMSGRKGRVLRDNNQVCFEVDTFSPNLDEYASVLVEGRLVAVADLHEKRCVKTANDQKYQRLRNGYRPGHGRCTALADLPLTKILVEQISGRRREGSCAPATRIEQVIA